LIAQGYWHNTYTCNGKGTEVYEPRFMCVPMHQTACNPPYHTAKQTLLSKVPLSGRILGTPGEQLVPEREVLILEGRFQAGKLSCGTKENAPQSPHRPRDGCRYVGHRYVEVHGYPGTPTESSLMQVRPLSTP
jgi:hypothetical protein